MRMVGGGEAGSGGGRVRGMMAVVTRDKRRAPPPPAHKRGAQAAFPPSWGWREACAGTGRTAAVVL